MTYDIYFKHISVLASGAIRRRGDASEMFVMNNNANLEGPLRKSISALTSGLPKYKQHNIENTPCRTRHRDTT